jgi:hypothetical protein
VISVRERRPSSIPAVIAEVNRETRRSEAAGDRTAGEVTVDMVTGFPLVVSACVIRLPWLYFTPIGRSVKCEPEKIFRFSKKGWRLGNPLGANAFNHPAIVQPIPAT